MRYKFLRQYNLGVLDGMPNFQPICNRRPLSPYHSSRVNRRISVPEKRVLDKTYCFFYFMERDGHNLMIDKNLQATYILQRLAKLDSKSLRNPSLKAHQEMVVMQQSAITLWRHMRPASGDPDRFDTEIMSCAMDLGTYHPVMTVLKFFEQNLTLHRIKLLEESSERLSGRLRKNIRAALKAHQERIYGMYDSYVSDAYSHLLYALGEY